MIKTLLCVVFWLFSLNSIMRAEEYNLTFTDKAVNAFTNSPEYEEHFMVINAIMSVSSTDNVYEIRFKEINLLKDDSGFFADLVNTKSDIYKKVKFKLEQGNLEISAGSQIIAGTTFEEIESNIKRLDSADLKFNKYLTLGIMLVFEFPFLVTDGEELSLLEKYYTVRDSLIAKSDKWQSSSRETDLRCIAVLKDEIILAGRAQKIADSGREMFINDIDIKLLKNKNVIKEARSSHIRVIDIMGMKSTRFLDYSMHLK